MSVLLLTLGVLGQVRMPVCEAYIIRNSPEDKRSLILGLYYFGSMEAGGVLTPVVGYLIDHLGFETSYTIAAVTILAATLICWPFLKGSPD
jgi:MFS family permease